jgi:putative transposase
MPTIRRIIPQTGEIYHVYNRGVDKRDIFIDQVDYVRFLHDLYEFNDMHPAPDFDRRYKSVKDVGLTKSHIKEDIRVQEPIVEVLAFCLMKNHYHLLLRPMVENSVTLFMRKVNIGHAKAFNLKHNRSGYLFQGRYKIKHVDSDEYLKHLICYIHLNPLKFLKKLDKNKQIDINKTWEALNRYRWSSHLDYLGEDNFGSIINKRFAGDIFKDIREYEKFAKDWMKYYDKCVNKISLIAIDLN